MEILAITIAIMYYLFSLLFMVGNTKWERFKSCIGKIGYLIICLMPFCWAAFPVVLGMHCTIEP